MGKATLGFVAVPVHLKEAMLLRKSYAAICGVQQNRWCDAGPLLPGLFTGPPSISLSLCAYMTITSVVYVVRGFWRLS